MKKVKIWKKQRAKIFYFKTNVKLDRSGVIIAFSLVSWNYYSCVHINLETRDSIERGIPRDFEDTFSNFFQAICKAYEKK